MLEYGINISISIPENIIITVNITIINYLWLIIVKKLRSFSTKDKMACAISLKASKKLKKQELSEKKSDVLIEMKE